MTLNPISGPDANSAFDVPAGKNLYVPLTASDPGQTVSFAATSSNPSVTTTVLTGNPTLQLTVEGIGSDGLAFSGTMTIELFENLAPETVDVIRGLVESGFYDGLSFYRIVPDFVIQGGANGTKSVDSFNDEFDIGLTFNSQGLLAMANPGTPDSNTSEFFITDIDLALADQPQYLNFRHTIFGQLTSGFDLYGEIMNAQGVTDTNSTPTSPVTITSAVIIADNQNGVVQISQPDDFTGTSTITVTATSSDGSTAQQTFTINVAPPTVATGTQPLFLAPVGDLVTNEGTSISFQVSATQFYANTLSFSVSDGASFGATPSNVTVNVTAIDSVTATVTLTPAAGFTGTISLLMHVDDASYDLHDAQAFTLTVETGVEILSLTDPINAVSALNASASGIGRVGATVSLVADDGSATSTTYSAIVDSNGNWTISGIDVSSLADGTITFTATSTDQNGGLVEHSLTAEKDTVAPQVTISSVTDPINGQNALDVALVGVTEAGATVSVVATDGTTTTTAYTTTADASGNWSIADLDVSALADGTITFQLTVADSAGNVSETSTTAFKDTVAPDVSLTAATDPINIDSSDEVQASGTGEVGATISVVVTDGVNSTVAVTTTVASDGTWSISGIDVSPLNDGAITYVATATDAAGNSSQSTRDATKDTVAIVLVTDPVNAANANSTSASGTGEVGATISLVVSDGTTTTNAYTTTVDSAGTWSLDGIDVTALADGEITFTATATNAQGNSATSVKTVTKDTVPPVAVFVSVGDPVNIANQHATFVTGSADESATVSVVVSDGTNSTASMTTTTDELGTWTFVDIDVSGLADGEILYTVTVTDLAGNTATFTKSATKDTVAPSVAITSATDPIDLSNYLEVEVSGTGEAGATITVLVSDGVSTASTGTTTVNEDGTWVVSGIYVGQLRDGQITYTATAMDAASNSSQSTLTATKSTVSISFVTNPITAANAASVSANGVSRVGAAISLVASDGTTITSSYTTTVGADGTWSISGIDVSGLADGAITFTVTATDGEGNSAQVTASATKDTVQPALAITAVTDPIDSANATSVSVSGTGDVGLLVVVMATDGTNSSISYSVVVASDGTWQIDNVDVSSLNDGTITFTATTTDSIGNAAQSTITATKGEIVPNSLSGRVFIDSNGNGLYDSGELVLQGVVVTLHGVDADGNPIASQTTTTASDGTYSFISLAAGTYSIVQAQPKKILDGTTTVGSLNGSTGTNMISGIELSAGAAGVDYNFIERGLDLSMISARLFLASTPPADQILNDAVSQYGLAAPIVSSIIKNDADPTSAGTVSYTVTFSENVTGVDAADFAVYGDSGGSIAEVTGSGSVYTVTVNTGGPGSIGIRLVDDNSIVNADSSPLGGAGLSNGDFVGPTYTVTGDVVSVDVTTVTNPINASNQSSTSASGTGTAGAKITLVATDGTNSTGEYSATVASDGTWSISGINVSGLADGTITFAVVATNPNGDTADDSLTATKDTVAPTVSISSVTDPINAESHGNVTVSGTGEAGATISLTASDGTNTTSSYTTVVASDGTWSIGNINVSLLADGVITFTATATDAAGNAAQATSTATKDAVAPSIQITSVTDPVTIANQHETEAHGTGEVGATVSVVVTDGVNSTIAYTTTIGEDGTWTISGIDVSTLADGDITFTATATDAAGNSAAASLAATKVTVTIVSVTDPINAGNADNVTVSGTGEVDALISLVVTDGTNSTVEYTTTIGEDGTWTITGVDVTALDDGTLAFNVTATDSTGNTAEASATATKDTVAPEVAISSVTDPINISSADDVSISGTGETGATIVVIATDGTDETIEYTTVIGEDGTWTITNIDVSALADGTITFTVTATDSAGNTAETSASAAKDTVPPAVTLSSVTSPVTIANHRATSAGGIGEVGATISVTASDGTNTTTSYTTTVLEDGSWHIDGIDLSALADGTITFTVTATDGAGNTAGTSATVVKTTVAVDAATDPINADQAFSASISGTGEVGATVTVVATDGSNTTSEYTTTIGEDGTWHIDNIDVSSLADGAITYLVTASDALGNTAETSRAAIKDTVAPDVSVTNLTNPINAANAGSVGISGTGEVGATIVVVVSDGEATTVEYTTTVGEDGTWSIVGIDVSALSDGTLTFTVTATDAAGNSAETTSTATKDTVAPTVALTTLNSPITIASQHVTGASGTGEVGATVVVVATDGEHTTATYSTTVDEDGTWSIAGIDVSGLADGTITYTATATDAAGNMAESSLTTTKTTIAISEVDPINSETASSISVRGTGEAGATVSLVASDGNTTTDQYTTTILEDGTWSISGIDLSGFADGPIQFAASAKDNADNEALATFSATKDTSPPDVAIASVTDPINAENAGNVTISGTGETGAAITIVATDGTNASTEYTTTVAEDGTWSVAAIDVSALDDGTLTFSVTATDPAGNTASVSITAEKDTLAPSVAIESATDPITVDVADNVVVAGTGEAGATIQLIATDGTTTSVEYSTVVGEDGTWTISGVDVTDLADGTIVITATATDAAGNSDQISTAVTKETEVTATVLAQSDDTEPSATTLVDEALADEESWL